MAEDISGRSIEDIMAQLRESSGMLDELKGSGLGKHGPRVAGRVETREGQVVYGWDKGVVTVLDDKRLQDSDAQAARNNLATDQSDIPQVPYDGIDPQRMGDIEGVIQSRDGGLLLEVKVVGPDGADTSLMVPERAILAALHEPVTFTEREDMQKGLADATPRVKKHDIEGTQYSFVVPGTDDSTGVALVPDPVADTAHDDNSQTYRFIQKEVVAALIANDVLVPGRGDGSYLQSSLEPLDFGFLDRKLLSSIVGKLNDSISIEDGKVSLRSGLGAKLDQKWLREKLGLHDGITAEGIQKSLFDIVKDQLDEADPEQMAELIAAMKDRADELAGQQNRADQS